MLKITHILYSGLGGTADVCQILCKLDKIIQSKSSLIQVGPKKLSYNLFKPNNKAHFVKTYRFLTIFYFFQIFNKIKKEKPNLIFIHNFQIVPILIYKLFFNKTLKVIYIDHTPNQLKTFKDFFVCYCFQKVINFFVVLNKDSYLYLLDKIGINQSKIKIIPNSVNKNFIINIKKKETKKNSLIIGMASRINKLKRHDLIVNALEDNELKNFKIKCLFAGEGENINNIKNMIKSKNKFKFYGTLNPRDLKKWYQSLDVYIQATNGEGHSTSILQAMGMNLPILASNVSGIKNFLSPKKKIGFLFENKKKSLIKVMKKFIFMSNLERYNIIKSQKRYVLENYSEEVFLNKYKKIIKHII